VVFKINESRNRGLPCRATACVLPRKSVSPFCSRHAKSYERWGHPLGRSVRPKEFAVERKIVAEFLERHAQHPGVVSALALLKRWLDSAALGESAPALSEWQRLQTHQVAPLEILTTAAALFLLSQWRHRILPDDDRLTFAMGYHVLKLAPCSRRYAVSRGKPRMVSVTPGKRARRDVGLRLRRVLAPLLANIAEALSVEWREKQQLDTDLRTPFNTSSPPP
jgi:hypothetical protein